VSGCGDRGARHEDVVQGAVRGRLATGRAHGRGNAVDRRLGFVFGKADHLKAGRMLSLIPRRGHSRPSASATACSPWSNRSTGPAAAKRIIGATKTLTPEGAADPAFDVRGLAKR
jgi:hypothetical protein